MPVSVCFLFHWKPITIRALVVPLICQIFFGFSEWIEFKELPLMLKWTIIPAADLGQLASCLKSFNVSFSVECIRSVVAANTINTTCLLFDPSCVYVRVCVCKSFGCFLTADECLLYFMWFTLELFQPLCQHVMILVFCLIALHKTACTFL